MVVAPMIPSFSRWKEKDHELRPDSVSKNETEEQGDTNLILLSIIFGRTLVTPVLHVVSDWGLGWLSNK